MIWHFWELTACNSDLYNTSFFPSAVSSSLRRIKNPPSLRMSVLREYKSIHMSYCHISLTVYCWKVMKKKIIMTFFTLKWGCWGCCQQQCEGLWCCDRTVWRWWAGSLCGTCEQEGRPGEHCTRRDKMLGILQNNYYKSPSVIVHL